MSAASGAMPRDPASPVRVLMGLRTAAPYPPHLLAHQPEKSTDGQRTAPSY
jgi:hypothetical protein